MGQDKDNDSESTFSILSVFKKRRFTPAFFCRGFAFARHYYHTAYLAAKLCNLQCPAICAVRFSRFPDIPFSIQITLEKHA
jgi:hypothetical protein